MHGRRPTGYDTSIGMSYAKIERSAQDLRSRLVPGLPEGHPLPFGRLLALLRSLPVETRSGLLPVTYGAGDSFPAGAQALSRFSNGCFEILLAEEVQVAYDEGRSGERGNARFTLLHEAWHIHKHTELLIELSTLPHYEAALYRGTRSGHPFYRDSEWQANAGAAALLAPARGVASLRAELGFLTPRMVADRFGMSLSAAENRVRIVSEPKYKLM